LRLGETLATHAGPLAPPQTLSLFSGVEMYIIYVDESGTPELTPNSEHFVLAAVSIPLTSWKSYDSQLRDLLHNHRLVDVEIHTAWMARTYPEQERIPDFDTLSDEGRRNLVSIERRKDIAKASLKGEDAVRGLKKNYNKTDGYIHLTHAERMTILRDVADVISSWNDARLFGDAHKKSTLLEHQIVRSREFALEQVTSRFNTYLRNVHGSGVFGVMVHDQHQAESVKLTGIFRKWHTDGTMFTSIPNIAETPLFVDSSLTLMVQVADLVAYSTRRFFDRGETDLFDRIYPRYDRTPHGTLVGLRHFTGRIACSCRVCADHRR